MVLAYYKMPSLTSMAESILAQAKKLDAYLEAQNLACPSFDDDTLDQLPDELQDERWAFANDVNELKQLSRGATQTTLDCAFSVSSDLCYFYSESSGRIQITFVEIVDGCPRPASCLSLQAG